MSSNIFQIFSKFANPSQALKAVSTSAAPTTLGGVSLTSGQNKTSGGCPPLWVFCPNDPPYCFPGPNCP